VKPTVSFDDVKCIRETPKALLVVIEDDEMWVPKSVVDDDSEVYAEGHEGTLVVHEWWAQKEGL
jgi:hypothetical protein